MISKKSKIIITCVAIISLVIIASVMIWILSSGHGTNDYFATYTGFDYITKDGDSKIVYVMPNYVHSYPDSPVSLTDCAFSLVVNGTPLSPSDIHLFSYYGGGFDAQVSKGAGLSNSVMFVQDSISYTVTLVDVDSNQHISMLDQVTVECSEPLTSGISYRLNVLVDINATLGGPGLVYGTFQN